MKRRKLFCLLLASVMLLSLAACGKGEKEPEDPNLLTVGDFELLYKGASIMRDCEGNDALVLTLDFTNNSEETTDYFWSIYETAIQNDTELEMAVVYLNEETLEYVDDSQYQNVDPGATVEVQTAFELDDTTGEVEVTFEEMEGDKNDSITIDLSTVSRASAGSGSASLTGGKGSGSGVSGSGTGASSGGQLLDWWNGDWYGWWMMTGCWGYYEDMEGDWWDICGTIDIGEDGIGTVTLWDEDYTKSEPMVSASVSLDDGMRTTQSPSPWYRPRSAWMKPGPASLAL